MLAALNLRRWHEPPRMELPSGDHPETDDGAWAVRLPAADGHLQVRVDRRRVARSRSEPKGGVRPGSGFTRSAKTILVEDWLAKLLHYSVQILAPGRKSNISRFHVSQLVQFETRSASTLDFPATRREIRGKSRSFVQRDTAHAALSEVRQRSAGGTQPSMIATWSS